MKQIKLNSLDQYSFAYQILKPYSEDVFGAQFHPDDLRIDVSNGTIGNILSRLSVGEPIVFPYPSGQKHHWMVTGPDIKKLQHLIVALRNFIIPTYGEFPSTNGLQRKMFDPEGNDLQKAGAKLFPAGYYVFQSPSRYLNNILSIFQLWLDLENKRPSSIKRKNLSYRELYNLFLEALNKNEFDIANNIVSEIQKNNLSTADNISFLKIQIFSFKSDWDGIWNYPNFENLSKIRMPREVRGALITAFYHKILEVFDSEGRWEDALSEFQIFRPKLGLLLVGRFGLTQDPVLKVFAYQATLVKDLSGLEEIEKVSDSASFQKTINALKNYIPRLKPTPESIKKPFPRVLQALDENDYDKALKITDEIDNKLEKALLLLEIGFFSNDFGGEIVRKALSNYEHLDDSEKEDLQNKNPQVLRYINTLEQEALDIPKSSWEPRMAILRENVWRLICELEVQLRQLIETRYQTRFGDTWVENINLEWREKWSQSKMKDEKAFEKYGKAKISILNYSYMGELMSLINNEWSLFEDIFGPKKPNKLIFTEKLDAVIKVRNPLAHNRPVPETELKLAENNSRQYLLLFR